MTNCSREEAFKVSSIFVNHFSLYIIFEPLEGQFNFFRDCGVTLRLADWGGGGASLVTRYWRGTRQLSLQTLYNSKIIGCVCVWGGGGGHVLPPAPCPAVSVLG